MLILAIVGISVAAGIAQKKTQSALVATGKCVAALCAEGKGAHILLIAASKLVHQVEIPTKEFVRELTDDFPGVMKYYTKQVRGCRERLSLLYAEAGWKKDPGSNNQRFDPHCRSR